MKTHLLSLTAVTASVLALALLATPAWTKDVTEKLSGVTPIEACPVVIDQPGAYIVTANLGPSPGQPCIYVSANFVTIDLNGFTLTGSPTSGNGIDGQGPDREAITVLNGTITEFGNGMDLSTVADAEVRGVRAVHNRLFGIAVGGRGRVTDSIASDNGIGGIMVAGAGGINGNCIVSGNTANENGEDGLEIRIPGQCTVTGNTLNGNDAYGAEINCPSNVIGNTALGNTLGNLHYVGAGCTDIDNLAP
jgi:parallel beta-helix repeat protein